LLLNEELERLHQSTVNALQESWNEVEVLNQKCTSQDEIIKNLGKELDTLLKDERKIEENLEGKRQDLKAMDDAESAPGNYNEEWIYAEQPRKKPHHKSLNNLLGLDLSMSVDSISKLKFTQRLSGLTSSNENEKFSVDATRTTILEVPSLKLCSPVQSMENVDQLKFRLEQREKEILHWKM
jgi:hypothetical protein